MDADTAMRMLDDREREVAHRLTRLLDDEASLRHDRADANADDEHDPEGSTLSGEWAQVDALRRGAEAERAEIAAARERVAAGAFGTCENCGRPVADARLEVMPFARRCISCAA